MIHFLVTKHKSNLLEVGINMQPTQTDNRDDQELANALAGLGTNDAATTDATSELTFEEAPAPNGPVTSSPFGDAPAAPAESSLPVIEPLAPVEPAATAPATTSVADPALEGIKKQALDELRPLVDKLNVQPEEKFDTYLLLLRSTDDASLIGPAHDAAKEIPDEARRAQALLDIIKEIDYLSSQK